MSCAVISISPSRRPRPRNERAGGADRSPARVWRLTRSKRPTGCGVACRSSNRWAAIFASDFAKLRRSPGFAITASLRWRWDRAECGDLQHHLATFLAPLPYPNGNELVVVWNHYKGEQVPTTIKDFAYFAARARSFQRLDYESGLVHLTSADASQVEIAGVPDTWLLHKRTGDTHSAGSELFAR